MPKILDRLVSQLKAKGKSEEAAYAIANSVLKKSGNLNDKGEATSKGIARGNMTPGQRAKNRASKSSGRPSSDYVYSSSTNRATLRKKK